MRWLLPFALLFFWQFSNAQCSNYQYKYSFDCNQNEEYPIDTFGLIIECTHPFVISIDGEFHNDYAINNANQTYKYYYNLEYLIIDDVFELIIYMPQFCIDTLNIASECGSLPLELVDFEAFNLHGINVVNWQTASAINEDFFIVQFSDNGIDFNELAKIPVINHTAGIEEYQYLDKSVNEKRYYRLLSQDDSGIKRIISPIKLVDNPSFVQATVIINDKQIMLFPSQSKWELYNNYGQLIASTTNGNFDLNQYPLGIYIVSTDGYSTKIANW